MFANRLLAQDLAIRQAAWPGHFNSTGLKQMDGVCVAPPPSPRCFHLFARPPIALAAPPPVPLALALPA
eukprot:1503444-Pleurochrysis_carterae.AAC.1